MQIDFHYYATYCAAIIAGYSHEEAMDICYSCQFTDECSRTFLAKIKGPMAAATTQLQAELVNARTDLLGLQDITRIWASFHFLPDDLNARRKWVTRRYRNKYRLICGPNGDLLVDTVMLAKNKPLQAVGLAMHILADTWAHRYFAGTPSLVINNVNYDFYELVEKDGEITERQIVFKHSPTAPDDVDKGSYTSSLYQISENSIMNLGHGRAGHFPDYSFAIYRYMPAWGKYREIVKNNPSDYMQAFCQMVYALKFLNGINSEFLKAHYDYAAVEPYRERIFSILIKRQIVASEDWKAFGEELSGRTIDDFDINRYADEYKNAPKNEKDDSFLGKFILAALAQKSMVTNKIYKSGNLLAGYSVDYNENGFQGIKDYARLINDEMRMQMNDSAEMLKSITEENDER